MLKNIFLMITFVSALFFALPGYAASGTGSNNDDSYLHSVKINEQSVGISKWIKIEQEGKTLHAPMVFCSPSPAFGTGSFRIDDDTIDIDVAEGVIKQPLPGFPVTEKYTISQCNNAGCAESKVLSIDTFKVSAILDDKYLTPVYKYTADPKVFVVKALDPSYGKNCRSGF